MSGGATTGTILLDVAVILVAARAGGLLFERVNQPPVIGEIAAGIVLGPTLLGALPGDPSSALFPQEARSVLKLIGDLGLALFMFTVGWDLDLRLVRHRERAAAFISIASIVLPFALGLGLAAFLHPDHAVVGGQPVPFAPFALFIGAALSVTAFPVLRAHPAAGRARRDLARRAGALRGCGGRHHRVDSARRGARRAHVRRRRRLRAPHRRDGAVRGGGRRRAAPSPARAPCDATGPAPGCS